MRQRQFNYWTEIGPDPETKGMAKGKRKILVRCKCGNEKSVLEKYLLNGESKSCGCIKHDVIQATPNDWGGASKFDSYLYNTWYAMMGRCYKPENSHYPNYGGRGITVCEEWKDFTIFCKDMSPRPEGMTIDRKDVNGNYCKENCRWSTPIEQANNRRSNRLVTYNGETKTIAQWSRETGVAKGILRDRIESGMPPEQAFLKTDHLRNTVIARRAGGDYGIVHHVKSLSELPEKFDSRFANCRDFIEWHGTLMPYSMWAEFLEIRKDRLHNRLKQQFIPAKDILFMGGDLLHIVDRVPIKEDKSI